MAMLQIRRPNEQFNSLPDVFSTYRSQISFISSDRPASSELVDLHIYLIPKSIWKDVQHFAQNEAMDEAVSAGFVRVPPDTKLHNLRQSIDKLCATEYHFPRDFLFLRSVGRSLTRVKPAQENELKVKNYRPPEISAPEIYLLEGRHEDYAYIPSTSPTLSSASYLFGNRYQRRLNVPKRSRIPSKISRLHQNRPLRAEQPNLPTINKNESTFHLPLSEKKNSKKPLQVETDIDDSSSLASKGLTKLKQEQERLRKRQAELQQMRRAAEEKRIQLSRNENPRQPRRQEKAQSGREENEHRHQEKFRSERRTDERRRQEKAQSEPAEKERRSYRRQEKVQSEPVEKERRSYRRQEKVQSEPAEKERRSYRRPEKVQSETVEKEPWSYHRQERFDGEQPRSKQDVAATKIQASFRSFKDRKALRERQINGLKSDSPPSSPDSHTTIENFVKNEKTMDINDDELSDGEIFSRSSSIGSTSEDYSNPSRSETRTIIKEHRESIHSNSSSTKLKRKISLSKSSYSNTKENVHSSMTHQIDDENTRTATVTKIRQPDEELIDVSTPDIHDNDTYELERRAGEIKRRRQLEEEKRKSKELEEQRQREPSKRQGPGDPESLRLRLQALRTDRVDLVKARDEAISNLKSIHSRLGSRRKEARDVWKKKYFREKKRTTSLEEQATQGSTELDKLYKKTEQTIDNECKHSAQVGFVKEAEIATSFLQLTRSQHKLHDVQSQLDQAKLRLNTDVKLRNQAENECRVLKHELNQAKMNLNHIKN